MHAGVEGAQWWRLVLPGCGAGAPSPMRPRHIGVSETQEEGGLTRGVEGAVDGRTLGDGDCKKAALHLPHTNPSLG